MAACEERTLIADAVAAFTTGTPFAALPRAIVAKARRHILDTLACGLAGACSAEGRAVRFALAASEPAGPAPVWGTPLALSPRAAALANGTACHAFELDDTGGCDHSGAVVVPAALAALSLAERPVDGRTLILAVVLGYEVARRALEACGGYAPHNEAGWHSTATCGTFGAAAAAAGILALTETETRDALGHAASFSGGLWAFIHDGAGTKRVHAGRAAEGGLLAALLARSRPRRPGAGLRGRLGRLHPLLRAGDGRSRRLDARARRDVAARARRHQAARGLPQRPFGHRCGRRHPGGPSASQPRTLNRSL